MAFNPFHSFRKYQRIWMVAIMMLVMVTFVLCTGAGQGDLQDILLRVFRPKGSSWAKLDGSSLYSHDFHETRERRNMANEFMRKAGKQIVARMDDYLKPENVKKLEQENPKEREQLGRISQLRTGLDFLLRRPRFFPEIGVKADEIVDFRILLAEADRLGIELTNDAVKTLAGLELGGREWFSEEVFRVAYSEVRRDNNRANETSLIEALRDEFRVRLAQRVLGIAGTTRLALTPGQMWEFYKEKRLEYQLALLPLQVEDFVAKVPAPNDTDLSAFFEQNRTNSFDPTSPKPGFAIPPRTKVAWISADPNSDYYKKASKLAVQLDATPPFPGLQMGGWQVVTSTVAKNAAAHFVFESVSARGRHMSALLTEPTAAVGIAAALAQQDWPGGPPGSAKAALASLIGAAARPDLATVASYLAVSAARHPKAFEAGLAEEAKKRTPVYATLTLLGAMPRGPLAVPGVWDYLRDQQTMYLPVSILQDEMIEFIERNVARGWVQKNMMHIKKKLEEPYVTTARAVERVLESSGQEIGLQRGETKEFGHRYNIHEAKELEPLRKSFTAYLHQVNQLEGRDATPENKLKEDDFWRLFFDGSETYSATGGRYQAKPWPPVVRIQSRLVQRVRLVPDPRMLNDPILQQIAARAADAADSSQPVTISLFDEAERPFLFWRIADEGAVVPESLEQVKNRVVEAWKFNKARESLVLPRARKIAESATKSATPNLGLALALDELKKDYQVKSEIITLKDVAPLVPVTGGGMGNMPQTTYQEYSLPANLIPYPRKDTAADLLHLYDLQKPIETGYAPLDEINKALYTEVSKDQKPQGKYVQILTNEPRTVFYVALQSNAPITNHKDFKHAVMSAFGHDRLFERGQFEAAKALQTALTAHLRDIHKAEMPSDETRKSFDDAAGQ